MRSKLFSGHAFRWGGLSGYTQQIWGERTRTYMECQRKKDRLTACTIVEGDLKLRNILSGAHTGRE